MFELKESTPAKLTKVTSRHEMHGEDHVAGVSISIRVKAPNALLDLFEGGLLEVFYDADDGPPQQSEIDGTVIPLPHLKSKVISTVRLKTVLMGWTLRLAYGIDGTDGNSAIVLGGCKIDKVCIELMAGGSIEVGFRAGSSSVDEIVMGRLNMLAPDSELDIKLTAPMAPAPEPDSAPKKRGRPAKSPAKVDAPTGEPAEVA